MNLKATLRAHSNNKVSSDSDITIYIYVYILYVQGMKSNYYKNLKLTLAGTWGDGGGGLVS